MKSMVAALVLFTCASVCLGWPPELDKNGNPVKPTEEDNTPNNLATGIGPRPPQQQVQQPVIQTPDEGLTQEQQQRREEPKRKEEGQRKREHEQQQQQAAAALQQKEQQEREQVEKERGLWRSMPGEMLDRKYVRELCKRCEQMFRLNYNDRDYHFQCFFDSHIGRLRLSLSRQGVEQAAEQAEERKKWSPSYRQKMEQMERMEMEREGLCGIGEIL
jgi:hypothetical protein